MEKDSTLVNLKFKPVTCGDAISLGYLSIALMISTAAFLFAVMLLLEPGFWLNLAIHALISSGSNFYGILLIVLQLLGGTAPPPPSDGWFWSSVKTIFFLDMFVEAIVILFSIPSIACRLGLYDPDGDNCASLCFSHFCEYLHALTAYFLVQLIAKVIFLQRFNAEPKQRVVDKSVI